MTERDTKRGTNVEQDEIELEGGGGQRQALSATSPVQCDGSREFALQEQRGVMSTR